MYQKDFLDKKVNKVSYFSDRNGKLKPQLNRNHKKRKDCLEMLAKLSVFCINIDDQVILGKILLSRASQYKQIKRWSS